jgi:hypothetical protein
VVLEAMKMEHTIVAPVAARVAAVHFAVGDRVGEARRYSSTWKTSLRDDNQQEKSEVSESVDAACGAPVRSRAARRPAERKGAVPTDVKVALIAGSPIAGFPAIESTSFVSTEMVPQMGTRPKSWRGNPAASRACAIPVL